MSALNFFELQEHVRRSTRVLLVAFVLAVVVVVGAIDFFLLHWRVAHYNLLELVMSPLTLAILALLGAVLFEEKTGRSLATTVALVVAAAAVLYTLSSGSLRGGSFQSRLWHLFNFATAPQTMLVWCLLVLAFVRDRATLAENFMLALALLPAAIALRIAINLTLSVAQPQRYLHMDPAKAFPLLAAWSVIPLAVIAFVSLRRMRALRAGGVAVAESLGARRVELEPKAASLRQLRNVVEETAIAASIPAPELYVLEETEINALAAGWLAGDAVLMVTRGAIDQLSRDELQAVVAHEMAHIVNDDIRLDIRLMGLLAGLTAIAGVGRRLIKSLRVIPWPIGIPLTIVGATILSIGYLGAMLADMIRAAVSHSREYLADACAVQFMRQVDGLRGALGKIAAQEGKANFAGADQVAHMLFADASANPLFSTHPPADLRALAIDPRGLDAPQAPRKIQPVREVVAEPTRSVETPAARPAAAPQPQEPQPQAAPTDVLALAHDPQKAPALTLSLLIGDGVNVRAQQLGQIQTALGEQIAAQVRDMAGAVQPLSAERRLSLALVTLSALKQRPRDELTRFRSVIRPLIHADGEISAFEYALATMIETHLGDAITPRSAPESGLKRTQARDEIVFVLSVFAHVGRHPAYPPAEAFRSGLARALPGSTSTYSAPSNWADQLDTALARLDTLAPLAKQALIEGLVATLMHDGTVTTDEQQLLRAVCTRLHSPVPSLPRTA